MATGFVAWGMTGTLATEDPLFEHEAFDVLETWISRIDETCNRFKSDSEISRLNDTGGTHSVSQTLAAVLGEARRASEMTDGLCDPTILVALEQLGYDRDFAELYNGVDDSGEPVPAPGLNGWSIDVERRVAHLEPGVRLDLGASAKAFLADAVLAEISLRGGALVEVGGDVALSGHGPNGPWVIGVADRLEVRGDEPRVALERGGLATSSINTRAWRRGDERVNHIVDPRTGHCADGSIATATVAATDCLSANALATAAILWGDDAPARVAARGASARFVRRDGAILLAGGWPEEVAA